MCVCVCVYVSMHTKVSWIKYIFCIFYKQYPYLYFLWWVCRLRSLNHYLFWWPGPHERETWLHFFTIILENVWGLNLFLQYLMSIASAAAWAQAHALRWRRALQQSAEGCSCLSALTHSLRAHNVMRSPWCVNAVLTGGDTLTSELWSLQPQYHTIMLHYDILQYNITSQYMGRENS